jgi:hypothetical protein
MSNGDLVSVFIVPVARNRMSAGMMMFAGPGAFDQFTREAQQLADQNIIRSSPAAASTSSPPC